MASRFLLRRAIAALLTCAAVVGLSLTAQASDDTSDHPMLSRVTGTVVGAKTVEQFGVVTPYVAGTPMGDLSFEGKVTKIDYNAAEGSPPPGEVKIYRNFLAAITKVGGRQLNKGFDSNDKVSLVTGAHVFTLSADKKPPVAILNITNAYNYQLTIVEPEAIEQGVEAGTLAADIKAKGFATLHIGFDTNNSELKADGEQAVDEVAKLLRADPSLRLSIEGHTDSVGSPPANQKLSEGRARAVAFGIQARGIDAKRLASKGFGSSKPVADNATEAGRGENRRVELVKVR